MLTHRETVPADLAEYASNVLYVFAVLMDSLIMMSVTNEYSKLI